MDGLSPIQRLFLVTSLMKWVASYPERDLHLEFDENV